CLSRANRAAGNGKLVVQRLRRKIPGQRGLLVIAELASNVGLGLTAGISGKLTQRNLSVAVDIGPAAETFQQKMHEDAMAETLVFLGDLAFRTTGEQDNALGGALQRTGKRGDGLVTRSTLASTELRIITACVDDHQP